MSFLHKEIIRSLPPFLNLSGEDRPTLLLEPKHADNVLKFLDALTPADDLDFWERQDIDLALLGQGPKALVQFDCWRKSCQRGEQNPLYRDEPVSLEWIVDALAWGEQNRGAVKNSGLYGKELVKAYCPPVESKEARTALASLHFKNEEFAGSIQLLLTLLSVNRVMPKTACRWNPFSRTWTIRYDTNKENKEENA